MPKVIRSDASDAAGVSLLHPVDDPAARRALAATLHATRLSTRWLAPRDARSAAAFSEIDPTLVFAAFDGARPVGAVALRRGLRDPFRLTPRRAAAAWGPAAGAARWAAYHAAQAAVSARGFYVSMFWVAPDRRGAGIGSALLRMLASETAAPVTALARPAAAPLFARCGWTLRRSPAARLLARATGCAPMRLPPAPRG